MRISDWSSDVCSSNLSTPEGAMSYAMGVDVSKSTLEVCAEPSATTRTFANDQVGIAELIAWLLPMKPSRVVFEASGGFRTEARRVGEALVSQGRTRGWPWH